MGTIEGDIFNESNKGTFLTSLDTLSISLLTYHVLELLLPIVIVNVIHLKCPRYQGDRHELM